MNPFSFSPKNSNRVVSIKNFLRFVEESAVPSLKIRNVFIWPTLRLYLVGQLLKASYEFKVQEVSKKSLYSSILSYYSIALYSLRESIIWFAIVTKILLLRSLGFVSFGLLANVYQRPHLIFTNSTSKKSKYSGRWINKAAHPLKDYVATSSSDRSPIKVFELSRSWEIRDSFYQPEFIPIQFNFSLFSLFGFVFSIFDNAPMRLFKKLDGESILSQSAFLNNINFSGQQTVLKQINKQSHLMIFRKFFYNLLILLLNPRSVYITGFCNTEWIPLIYVCNSRKIPVIDYPHGLIGLDNFKYLNWHLINKEMAISFPNYFAFWFESDKHLFDTTNNLVDCTIESSVIGFLWPQYYNSISNSLHLHKNKFVSIAPQVNTPQTRSSESLTNILLVLQTGPTGLPTWLATVFSEFEDHICLIVKPAPQHNENIIIPIILELNKLNIAYKKVSRFECIESLISESDLVISGWSSVLLDAALFETESLIVSPYGLEVLNPYISSNDLNISNCTTPELLRDKLLQYIVRS